jgi:hypothetical protein
VEPKYGRAALLTLGADVAVSLAPATPRAVMRRSRAVVRRSHTEINLKLFDTSRHTMGRRQN